MKKFSWKTWLVIGVVTVVGAVAGFLLAVGIARHREDVLLTVCWDEEGRAGYVGDDIESQNAAVACEGSQELVWPAQQVPITLSSLETQVDGSLGETTPRLDRVLNQAIRDLNRQVGFELYRWIPAGTVPVSGWIHFGGALEARRHGELSGSHPGRVSHMRGPEGDLGGHVYIRSDVESDERLLFRVLEHELLHLAGLRHSTFTASIMYPFTRDDSTESRMSTAHVTDAQRARLRELYVPRGRQ